MGEETTPQNIDLAQVNWPFCMLELKSALKGMQPGQLLSVTVSDPAVLAAMEQVLNSSPDQVISTGERGPHQVLIIQKGASPHLEE